MTEQQPTEQDKDPEPVKHADAERVGNEQASPEEFENDPSRNPEDEQLRDVKGG